MKQPPLRVLFIDEIPDERAMYRTGLELLGFELSVEATVADGLQSAATFRPDVIVLHLETGQWHFCDALRHHDATGHIPVIVITAAVRADRLNRDRALRTQNCAAFLGKPCTHEDVAAVVRRVIAGERQIEIASSF